MYIKQLFVSVTNIAKNSDKSKLVHSGYGITSDGAHSWTFGNDFARNAVIFGTDNSSSSHTDNRKNNLSVKWKRCFYY